MRKIRSFFKTSGPITKPLSFGLKSPSNFNYLSIPDPKYSSLDNYAKLIKEMNDSYVIESGVDDGYSGNIEELKLTNQSVLTWEDLWIDPSNKTLVDPKIEKINLQKNDLVHANFNLRREEMKELKLEGNRSLRAVFIYDAPKLEVLDLSNCQALEVVNLGFNGGIKALIAKNCNLSSQSQETLLRDFRPTITSSSNRQSLLFRKEYETILDLRGNQIDWGNRKVASKIRLLLCNNWLVLWDNPPPPSIIPPQMYSFFTSNLEEALIKEYYG